MELQFVDRSRGSVAGAALMLVARRQVEVDGDWAFARPLTAACQGMVVVARPLSVMLVAAAATSRGS